MMIFENENKVTDNSNLKNNSKRKVRVQVRNIDLSRKIQFQVQNNHSNLNSSLTGQKGAKNKLISIKKSKELFAAFRNVIRYDFQERNQISSLPEKSCLLTIK